MLELSKIPEQVAQSLGRPFLKWLMEDRTRTNNKIDLVSSPTAGNVPTLDANGELEDSSKAAPTGDFVGTTDTQTLTNKTLTTPTIASFVNATHNHEAAAGGGTLDEDALALTDVATNNASTSKHGFMPKLGNDATKFFDGQGNQSVPDHGSLGGLADDDHSQYLNTTRHDTATRHGDAVVFTVAMTDYSSTSTITGWASYTTKEIFYKKIGKLVYVWFRIEGTAHASTTTASFTLPYAAKATAPGYTFVALGKDDATYLPAIGWVAAGASTVNLYKDWAMGAWSTSVDKNVDGQFFYEAAS